MVHGNCSSNYVLSNFEVQKSDIWGLEEIFGPVSVKIGNLGSNLVSKLFCEPIYKFDGMRTAVQAILEVVFGQNYNFGY